MATLVRLLHRPAARRTLQLSLSQQSHHRLRPTVHDFYGAAAVVVSSSSWNNIGPQQVGLRRSSTSVLSQLLEYKHLGYESAKANYNPVVPRVMWNIADPGWAKRAICSFFVPFSVGATAFVHHMPQFDPTLIVGTTDNSHRHLLRAADRLPNDNRAAHRQEVPVAVHLLQRGRTTELRRRQRVAPADRPQGVGGLRADRDARADLRPSGKTLQTGLHGGVLPASRSGHRGRRRGRAGVAGGGEHRGARQAELADRRLRRIRERARKNSRLHHGRPRLQRRGRLFLFRHAERRRHQLIRVPHRSVRGGERAAGTPGRLGVGGSWQSGPDQRKGGQGIRRSQTVGQDNKDQTALVEELQEHVKRVTAPYKYPRRIEFVDSLPKTISGKIRRAELRQLERERLPPASDGARR